MKKLITLFLIFGLTLTAYGATREKILRTGLVDTFSEVDALVADKTLVNEEDAITFDSLIKTNANLTVGNATTSAGVLTLLEDTDAGANFASFQVPALAGNTVYTLPLALPTVSGQPLTSTTAGVMSWTDGVSGTYAFYNTGVTGDVTQMVITEGIITGISTAP